MIALDLSSLAKTDSVETLETFLQEHLRPVKPDPDFIQDLHRRLNNPPPVWVEHRRGAQVYLVVIFGLLSGVCLFWLIRRVRRMFSS
ncbi:MAG: hypothetical protein HPY45_03215 [Anaerolineae bacterium]|nr:hypothetical protein [Anaerolineae bacterium]